MIELPTMKKAFMDDRGRITLGSKLADKFGKTFAVVETVSGITLIPIAKDPLKKLQELGKPLEKYSIKQLRKMAMESAKSEVRRF